MRYKKHHRKFWRIAREIHKNPNLKEMNEYTQHGDVSTFDHCASVARMSYLINHKLKLKCKERDLVRGAYLHDYFLYDWHNWDGHLHGFSHPHVALKNADKVFELSEIEKNIIKSHMWPLTFLNIPRCREAWVVCLSDKLCSIRETLFLR